MWLCSTDSNPREGSGSGAPRLGEGSPPPPSWVEARLPSVSPGCGSPRPHGTVTSPFPRSTPPPLWRCPPQVEGQGKPLSIHCMQTCLRAALERGKAENMLFFFCSSRPAAAWFLEAKLGQGVGSPACRPRSAARAGVKLAPT